MSATPAKVLVIDDEPPIRKLLRMGLRHARLRILEAATGKTSLELLGQKPDWSFSISGCPTSKVSTC